MRNPLDDLEAIKRLDRFDMLGKIAHLADQCREGWRLGKSWSVPARLRNSKKLLLAGMGGSAIGGDLLHGLFGQALSRPILVNRDYDLPAWVDRQTVVLAISYSGNTEETLSAFRQARARRLPTLAIASGGKLGRWARRSSIPFLDIPKGWPPRAAVGYTTFAPAGLLSQWGWLRQGTIPLEKGLSSLERFIRKELIPQIPESANPAKKLARQLLGHLPILYGAAGGWEGIVYRWRTQLEENAKTLTFHHIFPEMTHNEISGWGRPPSLKKGLVAVFLEDAELHTRVRRRMEFVKRLIQREGGQVVRVQTSGASRFERMLKVIALGDFASVYLGILYRVDPTPVKRVEALKRYLLET